MKAVEEAVVKAWNSPDGIPAVVFYEALERRLKGESLEDAADYAVTDVVIQSDEIMAAADQYYRTVQNELYTTSPSSGASLIPGSKTAVTKLRP